MWLIWVIIQYPTKPYVTANATIRTIQTLFFHLRWNEFQNIYTPYYYHYHYHTAKGFPCQTEKIIIHIRRICYFILRISMVILRTAPSLLLYTKLNVCMGSGVVGKGTQEVSYIIIQINFENQGQSKNILNLNVLSIMYLRDIWHDDPFATERFIRLLRHITKRCTSNRI